MKRIHPSIDRLAAGIKPLSPRHRVAHLRALIGREPDGSIRRDELAALLRDELTPPHANDNRAP